MRVTSHTHRLCFFYVSTKSSKLARGFCFFKRQYKKSFLGRGFCFFFASEQKVIALHELFVWLHVSTEKNIFFARGVCFFYPSAQKVFTCHKAYVSFCISTRCLCLAFGFCFLHNLLTGRRLLVLYVSVLTFFLDPRSFFVMRQYKNSFLGPIFFLYASLQKHLGLRLLFFTCQCKIHYIYKT